MHEARTDAGNTRAPQNELKHRRVLLLVEDDPTVRQSLAATLAREKRYDVHTAKDGDEAIRFLATTSCDLIVSDLTMPGLSGFDLLSALHDACGRAGVIVLSANDSEPFTRAAGVIAHLVKPLRRSALLKAIAAALPD